MSKNILLIFMSLFLLSYGTASGIYKNPIVEGQTNKGQYSKIIFYNNTNLVLYPTSSAIGIGIIIDGKYVTKLKWGQYIELHVQKDPHELQLYHWDVFKFTNNYKLEFNEDIYVIELYCKPVSNAYVIKNELPPNFESNYVKVHF